MGIIARNVEEKTIYVGDTYSVHQIRQLCDDEGDPFEQTIYTVWNARTNRPLDVHGFWRERADAISEAKSMDASWNRLDITEQIRRVDEAHAEDAAEAADAPRT